MRLLYKFPTGKLLLAFMCIIESALSADAQQIMTGAAKGNFTSFTPQKTYTDIAKINALTPAEYRNNPDFGKCFTDSTQWYEQLDKRTLTTRTYMGPGNEIITQNAYDNINYVDANGWLRAVDTKLKPYLNGWAATQQEMPVYLYTDGSTALSIGAGGELMEFNKNVRFNYAAITITNNTVGDNGMYIKNAVANTDKIIRFGRGAIETDYTINKPLKLKGDLIISEDILLPAGYSITQNSDGDDNHGELEVVDMDGKQVAELKAPFCYDNHHASSYSGSYIIQKQDGGYKLEMQISSAWLNNPLRQYPVTIDPLVYGKRVYWKGGKIPSCLSPNYGSGSIIVTVPGRITITHFYVQGSWYTPVISKKYLNESFETSCSTYGPVEVPDTTTLPGLAYGKFDTYAPSFYHPLTCCIKALCASQTFDVSMHITRDSFGTSCDSTQYGWYDPVYASLYNSLGDSGIFEAWVIGRTVQDSELSVTPTSLCANQCSLSLNAVVYFGVPPYTMTHKWSKDTVTFGSKLGCAPSRGTGTLTLNIPNCPGAACTSSTLKVPPPTIMDFCGDTIPGLSTQTVSINQVPDVVATPDSGSVCSGTNVNITLSSCVSGSTFTWTGSDGTSGTTSTISDIINNSGTANKTVTYTVTPTGGGCTGNATVVPAVITPFTMIVTPSSPSICDGSSVSLTAAGQPTSYTWSPATGLSCSTCTTVTASPTTTTTYIINGTSSGGCSAIDTDIITVNPNPVLNVSKDTTIFGGHSVQLNANTTDSVTWTPSTGLSCTDCSNPIASPSQTTTYTVTAVKGNCTTTETVTITVIIPCNSLTVPSGFTPGIPGPNQYLHVLNEGDVTLQVFRIYNRWGQKVFETNDINGRWDGTFNGKPEPIGTYVYYAQITCQGNTVTIKGDVTLVR